MRIKPIPEFIFGSGGVLNEKGFITKDGKYCIEMVMHSDRDDSLVVTTEGEERRAIVITGTILNFFTHQSFDRVIRSAEDVISS